MLQSIYSLLFQEQTRFFYLSFVLFATAIGIDLVIFPAILQANNIDSADISQTFLAEIIGIVISSLFFAKFINKCRPFYLFFFAGIVYSFLVAIIYFFANYLLIWLFFIIILGFCWLIIVVSRFSWLNILLNNQNRGVGVALFSTCISLGLAIGPILVKILGATNYLSFLLSSLLILISITILLPINNKIIIVSDKKVSLKQFWLVNKQCFLARFFLDFQTYGLMSFSVLFGTNIGLSPENAGLLITAYMISTIADLIVGLLLKKYQGKNLINIGFLICLTVFIVIMFYHHNYTTLLILYFFYGIGIAFIFVAVFAVMSEDYQQKQILEAGATFQLIGTLGAFCGVLLASFIMQFSITIGFFSIFIGGCLAYFIIYTISHRIFLN